MSSDISIRLASLSKTFPIYDRPHHRLMQMLSPSSAKGRWHREFTALRDVSFEIHKGETVGIVGRNGSGKSTLLQIICGTLSPSAGELEVQGRIAALLELGAGFNPDFTGRENVFLNGTVLGLSRKEVEDRFDDIAAFADIGDFIDQPVKSYSSGMYVRLAFSVAIHVTPDILVVDEALAVGDEAFQRKCFSRIERIRNNGSTVLFVSHSAGTVLELCNRAILLDRGDVLLTGEPRLVVSRYQKMLYAPPEKTNEIREEIIRSSISAAIEVSDNDGPKGAYNSAVDASGIDEPWLDQEMKSLSTVRYVHQGARISNAHLESLDGHVVNVLRAGEEYIYTYDVQFDKAAAGVQFGMLIKTVSGVELGGGISAPSYSSIELVEEGAHLRAKFKFRCMLASGTYFLNAGVRGRIEQDEIFLDRLIDVAMFRVIPDPGRLATGLVDFGIAPSVHVVEEN